MRPNVEGKGEEGYQMENLVRKYHEMADGFLALGSEEEKKAFLNEEKLESMRENFSREGPPYVPGVCDVLTTYIPVEHQALTDFLFEKAELIIPLLAERLPYYLVPPSTYHISLVMVQDFRPVDMEKADKRALALTEAQAEEVRRIFSETVEARKPERFDLRLYGILFSPIDGAMLAVFVDDGQTLGLRTLLGDAVKPFLVEELREYKKPLIHVTLLRPLSQVSADVLRGLQDKQRRCFPMVDAGLTLPVRKIAIGRERVWMHAEVEDPKTVELR